MLKKARHGLTAAVAGLALVMLMLANTAEAGVERAVTGVVCSKCGLYASGGHTSTEYCESVGDNEHRCMVSDAFVCGNNHTTIVISELRRESHSFNHNRWDSISHNSGSHTYRIYCEKCSYSRVITIPCKYEQLGYHYTPF